MLRKLQTLLAFPTRELDMTPYLTSTILRQRYAANFDFDHSALIAFIR